MAKLRKKKIKSRKFKAKGKPIAIDFECGDYFDLSNSGFADLRIFRTTKYLSGFMRVESWLHQN